MNAPTLPSSILRLSEAARLLGVGDTTLKRWTEEGRIVCERTLGGHRRTALGIVLMGSQAFIYNAIFFTYALVLTRFYGIAADRVGLYIRSSTGLESTLVADFKTIVDNAYYELRINDLLQTGAPAIAWSASPSACWSWTPILLPTSISISSSRSSAMRTSPSRR